MQTDTSLPNNGFPANVPPKLIEVFEHEKRNQRALARRLNVNPGHINNLLVHGKEPVDEGIRAKLFLPKKVRQPLPAWLGQAVEVLAEFERSAEPKPKRTYNRLGKRLR